MKLMTRHLDLKYNNLGKYHKKDEYNITLINSDLKSFNYKKYNLILTEQINNKSIQSIMYRLKKFKNKNNKLCAFAFNNNNNELTYEYYIKYLDFINKNINEVFNVNYYIITFDVKHKYKKNSLYPIEYLKNIQVFNYKTDISTIFKNKLPLIINSDFNNKNNFVDINNNDIIFNYDSYTNLNINSDESDKSESENNEIYEYDFEYTNSKLFNYHIYCLILFLLFFISVIIVYKNLMNNLFIFYY